MSRKNSPLYVIASVGMILCSVYILMDISSVTNKNSTADSFKSSLLVNSDIKKIDAVLNKKVSQNRFVYTGVSENPFRRCGDDPAKKVNTTPLHDRPRLSLKGILLKNSPLAIIENANGETFIRGIGETILEQKIVKINDNKVTLHDSRGDYDLVVEEQ